MKRVVNLYKSFNKIGIFGIHDSVKAIYFGGDTGYINEEYIGTLWSTKAKRIRSIYGKI